MHTKTMEGLVGARTSMNLLNTPMRVFKEARRRGDTETMKRSLGYVGDFSNRAEEYKKTADKGMEEDAKEARKKAELQREEAVRKRKEESEKLEERIEEIKDAGADTVEISEEGKVLLKDNTDAAGAVSEEIKTETVKKPVTYTSTGEAVSAEPDVNISVSV